MNAYTIAIGPEYRVMAEVSAESFRKNGRINGEKFDDVITLILDPYDSDNRLSKLQLFDYRDDDQFVFFDADAVMRVEADLAFGFVDGFSSVLRPHNECHRFGIPLCEYFNTGIMWLDRAQHKAMFDHAQTLPEQWLALGDQTQLNIAARDLHMTIVEQDRRYNYLARPNDDYPDDTVILHRVKGPSRSPTIEAMKRDAI